jgi:phospholipid-binding lipoprotein MlaA
MLAVVALMTVGACAAPPPRPIAETDPYEAQNRAMHAFNKSFDQAVTRPVSSFFGDGTNPVAEGISNAASNLRTPRSIVNLILQGRLPEATGQTVRFAINSTVGIGGLFDPATAMGLERTTTSFGDTLHVWGVPEGDFIELPVLSASTDRDAVGYVVDFVIDPVGWILPDPWNWAARGVNVVSGVVYRARFKRVIDSILYESSDSYAQSRLLYLQNRRFELGQEAAEDDFFDPYEE